MNVPRYDIFQGRYHRDALWVEVVEGLGAACERMKELAVKSPGPYFVFSPGSHGVVASVDTSKRGEKSERAAS